MTLPLHPLNRDFHWKSATGEPRRLTHSQRESYDELGFFVIEDLFDDVTLTRAVKEIDRYESEVEAFLRTQPNGRMMIARAGEITFVPHLVTRSEALRDFCRSQPLSDIAHDLLGDEVRLYWDQAVYKKPGTEAPFPWHQDNGYTFVEPQQYLTCWVALTDATEDNGCPWVVPGLHRNGTFAHELTDLGFVCLEDPDGAVAVPVRAGGAAIFSSLTPHATGPNRTTEVRKSYIVQYASDGAVIVQPDGDGVVIRTPANDARRQFLLG